MATWSGALALSVGGVLGVNARYWLGAWIGTWAGPRLPWGTLVVNVSGSFAIGFAATAMARWLPDPRARLFVLTGFLGGYTTFSSLALEALTLWGRGDRGPAIGYMAGSMAAGFVAVALGVAAAGGPRG